MAPTVGEILFVDTNVFLTATDRSRARHLIARNLLTEAGKGEFHLALSGQVVREYLVVATRSTEANGLGLSPGDALRNVEVFTSPPFAFCEESQAVSQHLRELISRYGLTGRRLHDANIVATMAVHGISRLVTQNAKDFAQIEEVEIYRLDDT
jgi:predicted nucleic acid-binding protein